MVAPSIDALAEEYRPRGFEFLFVYTREAHPGERYPHHTSLEQKLRHAADFRERFRIGRPILVDDLAGTAHHAYGLLPDMCYLISSAGRVVYRADWTEPETLRLLLDYQLRRIEQRRAGARVGPFYGEFLGYRPSVWREFEEALELNGPQAVRDWRRAMEHWRDHPPKHG